MEKLYTADEAAEALRIDRNTLYVYVREKKIEGTKIGKYIRIRESELERVIREGV